ncbi:hypothetical protein C8046_15905 [Serinibacter arcticus]|uniref:HTTM-like domain-containing protein n=1 Tax=Serinibacter arcticus TaxID=1655435 RepID=A0A2U1ZY41_9MICO|nr:hypothetical protein [Serinibacter arcticus]PWD51906.1 hypothetical protein C8046_15905 [Serinibacter arcticus]
MTTASDAVAVSSSPRDRSPVRRGLRAGLDWFLAPVPLARVAAFRILIYAFVVLDVLWVRTSVVPHGYVPDLYRPTWLSRALAIPPLTPTQGTVLLWLLLASCVAAVVAVVLGRLQRTTGIAVALGFWLWMLNSQGFGYISHDHLALMVAVTVLPTAGVTRLRDHTPSQAAGWALRAIQLAVVATYFGSAILKWMRAGSPAGWANSAVFVWAIMRRGSPLIRWTLEYPWLLIVGQWGLYLIELFSPVVLWLRGRWLYVAISTFILFHLATFLSLGIHFLPTVVCWAAFLPLERLPFLRARRPA